MDKKNLQTWVIVFLVIAVVYLLFFNTGRKQTEYYYINDTEEQLTELEKCEKEITDYVGELWVKACRRRGLPDNCDVPDPLGGQYIKYMNQALATCEDKFGY